MYDKICISDQMHAFSVKIKNKKSKINGQTPRRLSHDGVSRNDRSISITTATKIKINLVVTMISPWQAPIIIGR